MSVLPSIIPGRRWDRILRACLVAPVSPSTLCRIVRSPKASWFRKDKSRTHKACQLLREFGWLRYDNYGEGYLITSAGKEALGLSEITVADDIPVPHVQVFGLRKEVPTGREENKA